MVRLCRIKKGDRSRPKTETHYNHKNPMTYFLFLMPSTPSTYFS